MGKRVVFVNGCFDVLHYGHLKLLEYAKGIGDYLVVAIDSDTKVRQSKGPTRPFNNSRVRQFFLESLVFVDKVEVFDSEQSLEELVKNISPDIMIVGSDYKEKKVVGSTYAKELVFFERLDGYSTTGILQDIANR